MAATNRSRVRRKRPGWRPCKRDSIVPLLRTRLNDKFARGAENQALLVETVTGIQTVKASALEPMLARRWEDQLAAYVSASFRTQNLASYGQEGVSLIGKIINAATLWYGARLVMDQDLSVGQFVAFNMFAQRVAQPVMRIAQLWTDFQQTGISMARLGDILNTRTEVPPANAAQLPPLKGRIQFDQVAFRYRPEAPPVLQAVQLDVRAGEVIGIVGRSGSGKSTLTKLVQRLYTPEQGRVLVDGVDISLIDAAQLRRQFGVVLQENWLFNRSVRENIAITDPAAPIQQVMHAARLAGAHDFVAELPEGYHTIVSEAGQARTAYLAETRRSLSERQALAASKHEQFAQERNKTEQRSRLAQRTAPVDGTVQQLAIHTEGGVVTPAQVLMVIVPQDGAVSAEVVIDNKDIGFVNAGQRAAVKLETFPFTRYGTIDATVQSVTADAVSDEKKGAIFPATLTLAQRDINVDGKRIRLGPGMNVTAEIATGRRRVIEHLLSPVQRALGESMKER